MKVRCPMCLLGEFCDNCRSTGYIEEPVHEVEDNWAPLGTTVQALVQTIGANMERAIASGHPLEAEQISYAEAELAAELIGRNVEFAQQHQIGPYFADFWFPDARLVVEVDGDAYHKDKERDQRRTDYLLAHGVERVLRFRALAVFSDPAQCVTEIEVNL